MRTRILNYLTNDEVEKYLKRNDIIFIPVGSTELHGGLPLNCEAIVSEGVALRCASKVDGLVLTEMGHFYAGATAMSSGTIQMRITTGIQYLIDILTCLYEKGFRRIIFLSLHSPSYLTVSPALREFFDKTHCPVMYIDSVTELVKMDKELLFGGDDIFTDIICGAYDIMGRLNMIPTVSEVGDFSEKVASSVSEYTDFISKKAYISGGVGYYFGKYSDHMPTKRIENEEHRQLLADNGKKIIDRYVDFMDLPRVVEDLRRLDKWQNDVVIKQFRCVPNGGKYE